MISSVPVITAFDAAEARDGAEEDEGRGTCSNGLPLRVKELIAHLYRVKELVQLVYLNQFSYI